MRLVLDEEGPNLVDFQVERDPTRSWFENCMAELDEYHRVLTTLNGLDTTAVFKTLSSITARVSEMKHECFKHEGIRYNQFRTRHLDTLLEECDRQFKFHSRAHATQEMEFRLSKGEF